MTIGGHFAHHEFPKQLMKKPRTNKDSVLAELRKLERMPPKKANRLIARHLQCETSQRLAHMVAEAARRSSAGTGKALNVPSDLLPPLI
jgi:hypothetical protein